MSIIIGLTGPTGSGKSSASAAAVDAGFKVINCDKVARKAVESGTPGLSALENAFGAEILLPDGSLDRKKLALFAFKNKESTELLNKTILPFIAELVKKEAQGQNTLLDAPTLFESGINSICKKNVAVLADREIRTRRIISRDNLTITEAKLRLNAGKPDSFYKENADYILYNNGDEEAFIKQFSILLNNIIGGF